ncbi:MAG: hypothetical protein WCF17_08550 [Terracidiphilus sp.]
MAALLSSLAQGQAIHVIRHQITAHPDTAVNSLSVSVSPSLVNFTLVSNGVAKASSAIDVTTSWAKTTCSPTCTVTLYGYFTSSTSALSSATGGNIPSSAVLGEVTTGTPTSYTPFTQTGPFGGFGASLLLFSDTISSNAKKTTRTDALSLEIELSGQPQMPAGSYTGILNIQAQTL